MTNNGNIRWTGKAPSIMLISLGCDKNLVDSEQMLSMLDEAGCTFTDEADKADVIIINSCCFIGDAKEESINTIIQAGELKNEKLKGLIVTGCLAQRYADEIKKELPEVDAVLGTTCFTDIVETVQQVLCGNFVQKTGDIDKYAYAKGHRLLTGGGYYAYLKIAEGCNKNCSYCVIPKVRGHYRSVPEEDLISDAKKLALSGVKELILIAQETTVYGTDLYKKKALPGLLRKLCAIDGIEWIRLMYCYPEEITDELIDVIASEEKICHYLDLPIQHINNDILKAMGRKTDKDSLIDVIGKLKRRIPDIALRTTLISGFPGENDRQHEELKAFIKEIRFDRLGCFTYSREEGTAAAMMKGQNKETVKKKRRGELMELQQEIAFEKESLMCGRELKVLIEGKLPDDDVYVGRTYRDAPDVDGLIFINNAQREYMSGDFVNVKVTGSHGYDLTGDVI